MLECRAQPWNVFSQPPAPRIQEVHLYGALANGFTPAPKAHLMMRLVCGWLAEGPFLIQARLNGLCSMSEGRTAARDVHISSKGGAA